MKKSKKTGKASAVRPRTAIEGVQTPDKVLCLMQAIILDGGSSTLSSLADSLGIPNSSARRMAAFLEQRGYISRVARGRYGVGLGFVELANHATHEAYLCSVARAPLEKLARKTHAMVHLGILENDMVTYLMRIGESDSEIATDQGAQREAYCTGIGKVLLAGLSRTDLDAYLSAGDFVRLTPGTITEAGLLKDELQAIRECGYGLDRAEMFDRIHCLAVPIELGGRTVAALSVSRSGSAPSEQQLKRDFKSARECASAIKGVVDGGLSGQTP